MSLPVFVAPSYFSWPDLGACHRFCYDTDRRPVADILQPVRQLFGITGSFRNSYANFELSCRSFQSNEAVLLDIPGDTSLLSSDVRGTCSQVPAFEGFAVADLSEMASFLRHAYLVFFNFMPDELICAHNVSSGSIFSVMRFGTTPSSSRFWFEQKEWERWRAGRSGKLHQAFLLVRKQPDWSGG